MCGHANVQNSNLDITGSITVLCFVPLKKRKYTYKSGNKFVCQIALNCCAVGGGLILTNVVKRRQNRQKTSEYCDVYASRASYVSDHLYEEVCSGPTHDTVENYADVGKRLSYISVQS